jgi:hypothetical protein
MKSWVEEGLMMSYNDENQKGKAMMRLLILGKYTLLLTLLVTYTT